MIRAAIIGCGKIADEHASAIRSTPGAEVCAVCDNEPLMAWQMAERLEIPGHFAQAEQMLATARPTVVHITTPPQSHFPLARLCLEKGCHVFIEKPFALTAADAEELVNLAKAKNLIVTAGHNHQYSRIAVAMRQLIARGFLGGDPIHMESSFPYELGSGPYAAALLGDKGHWVRRLPGGLAHNVISHGVSKIAEYLKDENPEVIVWGGQSRTLRDLGEREIFDELRITIVGRDGATAYFTFSSGIKPGRHEFRVFGPKNFLVADHAHQILVRGQSKSLKSFLTFFVPPVYYARQYLRNAWENVSAFLRRDFHMDRGRRRLLAAFYHSIANGGPPPLSYHEIILTARIMDAIFDQLRTPGSAAAAAPSPRREPQLQPTAV